MTNGGGPEPEVLRVGDSLTIIFTDTPSPIPAFEEKIKEDGTITLILNQTFKADGKTRGRPGEGNPGALRAGLLQVHDGYGEAGGKHPLVLR